MDWLRARVKTRGERKPGYAGHSYGPVTVPNGHNGWPKTDNAGKDRSKTGITVMGI
jgi:hypothetical protein